MMNYFKQCWDGHAPPPEGLKNAEANQKMKAKRPDNKFDLWFKGGAVDKFFLVTARGSNVTTEIRAGITTFLTAAYIMAVNPNILSVTGLDFEGLVFATAFSSFVATLMMGLWANLPFGLWPGMGMNAYFAYTIVGFKGTGYAVKKVMFAVFIEGIIFIVLSLLDVRRVMMKFMPMWLMKATMAGIGLFLCHIGLQAGNGIDFLRDNGAVLVDHTILDIEYAARVWVGILFFFVMSALITLRVPGAVMISILLSTFFCWILEAAGSPQFVYQPKCCLGEVTYPPTGTATPENNGWYPKPTGGWLPKPTCVDAMEVTGMAVSGTYGNWSIDTDGDGQYDTSHYGSLEFEGVSEGRNSLFAGGCSDTCQTLFGGFNYICLPWPDSPQPPVQISTGCWSAMAYIENDATITASIKGASFEPATNLADYSASLPPYTQIDGFGEGCIGGAGRIPKTFAAPTGFADAPKVEKAGDIVSPWPGWFACTYDDAGVPVPGSCFAGNIEGGTIAAFDTSDLTWENFGIPLITLLYIDFIGTAMFLYAAADLTGLVDPDKPGNFQGCYAAFMADAVGTCLGGLLGTSSVTTYGESMAGVYEGGRTGLTALVIAFFNFLCMFLAPFFSSIPTLSTGPALMMVGIFMIEGIRDIDWTDYYQAIPSLFCIILQPLTYKIEVGVIAGLFIWAFLAIATLRFTLSIPPLFRALPPSAKDFIARQTLDKSDQKKLADLGYEPVSQQKDAPDGANGAKDVTVSATEA